MKRTFKYLVGLYIFLVSSNLTIGQKTEYWGVAGNGGNGHGGVIYKLDSLGTYQVKHNFNKVNGGWSDHSGLIELPDGRLLGVHQTGGWYNRGTLFTFHPVKKEYRIIHHFSGSYGSGPGIPILHKSGKIYGTGGGGAHNDGIIYEFDLKSNKFKKLYDFNQLTTGQYSAGLCLATDGYLYGSTRQRGANQSYGSIFRFDPRNNSYQHIMYFNGTNGAGSLAPMIQASNGMLYGTTDGGGAGNPQGVLFELNPSNLSYRIAVDIDHRHGTGVRAMPWELNGRILCTTDQWGAWNAGTMFEYNPSTRSDRVIMQLNYFGTGVDYWGGFTKADNGRWYGAGSGGTNSGAGLICEYLPHLDTVRVIKRFDSFQHGRFVDYRLIKASNEKLYFCTRRGGLENEGTMLEFDPKTEELNKVLDFGASTFGADPQQGVVLASDGKLYGLTDEGGSRNKGVFYKYDPVFEEYEIVESFQGSNGERPKSIPIEVNGKLYFTTEYGGLFGYGVLHEYNPFLDSLRIVHHFIDSLTGNRPMGRLLKIDSNSLAGVCFRGGPRTLGGIFKYDISKDSVMILDWFESHNGSYPRGGLSKDTNGNLYGTTYSGGQNGVGVLYEYNASNDSIIVRQHFSNSMTGSRGMSRMINHPNGKMYGVLRNGGPGRYAAGVVFSFDAISKSYNVEWTMDGSSSNMGTDPDGDLTLTSDSCLVFVTPNGSRYRQGSILKFDPVAKTITKWHDLDSSSGGSPGGWVHYTLERTGICYPSINRKSISLCETDTFKGKRFFKNVTLIDTIGSSAFGCDSLDVYDIIVHPSPISQRYIVTSCEEYEWLQAKKTFTKSGVYIDTLSDINGCSYSDTLDLTIHYSTSQSDTAIGCNSYTWTSNGKRYSKSGQYVDTILNKAGCDSLIELRLTIEQHTSATFKVTGCNEYRASNGQVFQRNGSFNDTILNLAGCDSIITYNVDIKNISLGIIQKGDTLESTETNSNYQWAECGDSIQIIPGATNRQFVTGAAGTYAVIVSNFGCSDTSQCLRVTGLGFPSKTNSVLIFPNPNNGVLKIFGIESTRNIDVHLYDFKGSEMSNSVSVSDDGLVVSFEGSPGVYFIIVYREGEIVLSERLIRN